MNAAFATERVEPGVGASANVFRQEGEYWTIAYDCLLCRLRDSAGLRYLAYLLQRPGDKVAATQLLLAAAAPTGRTSPGRNAATDETELARVKATRAIRTAMQHIETYNAPLNQHLRATIKTGGSCSYAPDPRLPVAWEF